MLYAIADLHLSHGSGKPMDIFGENWRDHNEKIKENWHKTVRPGDAVIIPGDISWGMRMDGFVPDLEYLKTLPGKKILVRGNHDYWWDGIGKLNALDPDIFFIQNNFTVYEGIHICGTRGWTCPGGRDFTAHDDKIYRREALRLGLSLETAARNNAREIIAAIHFPPFSGSDGETLFTELLGKYNVKRVVYGHIHSRGGYPGEQTIRGISYRLVSADYVGFTPVPLL